MSAGRIRRGYCTLHRTRKEMVNCCSEGGWCQVRNRDREIAKSWILPPLAFDPDSGTEYKPCARYCCTAKETAPRHWRENVIGSRVFVHVFALLLMSLPR